MAKRFNNDFYDEYGNKFRIEIYDDEYTGTTVTEFKSGSEVISYEPQNSTETNYVPIITTAFELQIALNRQYPEATELIQLLNDLKNEEEGRFWCTVASWDALTNHIFIGYLLPDQVTYPNKSVGFFNMTFVDGLVGLKTEEYKTTSGDYFDVDSKASLWEHLTNCFDLLPIKDKYSSSVAFIQVAAEWTHQDMGFSINPLTRVRVSHSRFTTVDDNGQHTAMKAYEVIEEIAKSMYLTVSYMPNPDANYFIGHWYQYTGLTLPQVWAYNNEYQAFSVAARGLGNGTVTALEGGIFSHQRGLKYVNMQFDYNRQGSGSVANSTNEPTDYTEIANFQITSDDEILLVYGLLDTYWNSSLYTPTQMYGVFNLYLKVETGSKTVWYERDWSADLNGNDVMVGFNSVTSGWSDTEATMTVGSSQVKWFKPTKEVNDVIVDLTTDPLTDEFVIGDEIKVSIKFEFYGRARHVWSGSLIESIYDMSLYARDLSVAIIDPEDSTNVVTTGLSIKGIINENNSAEEDYDIILGYGQNASGSNLEVRNSADEWVLAKNRWYRTSGEYYLYELIIRELYRARKGTALTYTGEFRGDQTYGLKYFQLNHGDNEVLFPLQGRHDIGASRFTGKYVELTSFIGTPVIEFVSNTEGSTTTSSSSSTIADTSPSNSALNIPYKAFRVTGETGNSFLVQGVNTIDDSDYNTEDIQFFYIKLMRGNVTLLYSKIGTLGRSEFRATNVGDDVQITLGKTADSDDIFTGYVAIN